MSARELPGNNAQATPTATSTPATPLDAVTRAVEEVLARNGNYVDSVYDFETESAVPGVLRVDGTIDVAALVEVIREPQLAEVTSALEKAEAERDALLQSDVKARARHAIAHGSSDGLHRDLLAAWESAEAELGKAVGHIDRMIEEGVEAGLGLKSFTVENGEANLSATTEGVAEATVLVMLDGLADMLGDASNYVEFDLRRRGKVPVSVCVRRYHHPTPHELREKAEAERDALRAQAQRVEALHHPGEPVRDTVDDPWHSLCRCCGERFPCATVAALRREA